MNYVKKILACALAFTAITTSSSFASTDTKNVRQQYDFLKGDWNCTFVQFADGKEAASYPCTWKGRYTFDGLMFQDDFRMYHQDKMVFSGTTLRTWVEGKKRWDLAFLASGMGHWPNFFGTWDNDAMQITSRGKDQNGEYEAKIRFVNIQENSFLWQMDRSYDGGKTWQLDSEIRSTRDTGE